ncbi:MAG: DUF2235 domain-containing protein [Novosphingobium sp.]
MAGRAMHGGETAMGEQAAANPGDEAPGSGPAPRNKRILLFSDGTSNSSAKVFKTNVWRMYEAVDLGPTGPGNVVQVGYYNNGVGTSNFRPLATLGGVFGFGLKRNVLSLYEFLCRNYQVGDEIFVFGFSRGAFTIRLLVELIATQGIVRYDDPSGPLQSEADLMRQSREAYRRMHACWRLNNPLANGLRTLWLWLIAAVRRGWFRLRRLKLEPDVWDIPGGAQIEFVGLWDTVAAYGGPIVEITRAVDDWIYPLTMPDFRLSKKVKRARQALALDDARDSFQPMLWDETAEDPVAAGQEPRLKQVWFTGMHADVGGGYPDDSLSYVSLTWMMEEIGKRLRFLDDAVRRAYDLANDFGPMHDSRQGVGSYYRYQPRRIAALLDPPSGHTLGLRDPNVWTDVEDGRRVTRRHGLIRVPLVHESVFRRIIDGTDGYGPVTLPREVTVVRRNPDSHHADLLPQLPGDLQRDLSRLAEQARSAGPHDPSATLWDKLDLVWSIVWLRRAAYFATVIPSILLATMFLWGRLLPNANSALPICGDDRCALPGPIAALKSLVPALAAPVIDGWARRPGLFLLLLAIVGVTIWLGRKLEGRIQFEARKVWAHATRRIAVATKGGQVEVTRAAAAAAPPPPSLPLAKPSRLTRFHNGAGYQRAQQVIKWTVAPWLLGPVLMFLMIAAFLWVPAQLRIAVREETECRGETVAAPGTVELKTWELCTKQGVRVRKGAEYRIVFAQVGEWWDRGPIGPAVPASLRGVEPRDETLAMQLAILYKRVTTARYLQPIAAIQPTRGIGVLVTKLEPREDAMGCGVATFTAGASGSLHFFVNDPVPPFGRFDRYYGSANPDRSNAGAAMVTVIPVGQGGDMAQAMQDAVVTACTVRH